MVRTLLFALLIFLGGSIQCFAIKMLAVIVVARTFRTMLNNSGESGHPCVVPDLEGNVFSFPPLRILFAVGLSNMAFIMLR